MATDTAAIVIVQADTGQARMAPAEGDHATDAHAAGEQTAETLQASPLAHAESGMPQLNPEFFPNLIFWLVVAIVAIHLILTRVALPRIGTVMAERNDAIANDIELAGALKRRAEEAEAAYTRALAEARDEAHQIAAETRAAIDKELAALTAKADGQIAAMTADSERRIAEIRENAAKSVEEVARDTTGDLVRALLPVADDPAAIDAAIANRLKGLTP